MTGGGKGGVVDRWTYALTHPLDRADLSPTQLAPYGRMRRHVTGLLILTVLAVDR